MKKFLQFANIGFIGVKGDMVDIGELKGFFEEEVTFILEGFIGELSIF